MGYCERDCVVRVDRFKASGKWYDSHAVDMAGLWDEPLIHDALKKALERQGIVLEPGWFAVCLKPHHQNAHPIIIFGDFGE